VDNNYNFANSLGSGTYYFLYIGWTASYFASGCSYLNNNTSFVGP